MEVRLQDILEAREARARQQQALLEKYRLPLVCFTMNIAGPVKSSALIQRGFYAGLAQLDKQLPFEEICFLRTQELPTGCEAIFAVDVPARELKQICTDIEENHPLGRLFDMDVLKNAIKEALAQQEAKNYLYSYYYSYFIYSILRHQIELSSTKLSL